MFELLRKIYITVLKLAFIGCFVSIVFIAYLEAKLPQVEILKDVKLQVPMKIFSSDGLLIAEYGDKRLSPISIYSVPHKVKNAILATEDCRFYKHPGVDYRGIARAVVSLITTGTKEQGGSTITMQVARNFFLTRHKTYLRKINEILLALKIEQELSKEEILELYLNKIYFGKRAYGIAAAAEVYYGKNISDLSLAQTAMIAGLPQAPSSINPLVSLTAASKRRSHVLDRMLAYGFITKAEHTEAINEPENAYYHPKTVELSAPYVAEMVRQRMVEVYGESAYEQGFEIITTVHSNYQKIANRAVTRTILEYDSRHGFRKRKKHNIKNMPRRHTNSYNEILINYPKVGILLPGVVSNLNQYSAEVNLSDTKTVTIVLEHAKWARSIQADGTRGPEPKTMPEIISKGDIVYVKLLSETNAALAQIPEVEAALVAMSPKDGAITALVGGFDYKQSSFNRAIQAERQPGSAFKPFIYITALDNGFTNASIINDAPIVQDNLYDDQDWRPQNHTKKFYGPTRLRVGITQSRNLVSIRVLRSIGVDTAIEYLSKMGFDPNKMPKGLSLALGANHLTPLELATGYCIFPNGGYKVDPYLIKEVYKQQELIYTANPLIASATSENPAPLVVKPQHAYLMNSLLQDVIQNGTGRRAKNLGRKDLAGKTGTTNDQMDAWYAGYNNDLVVTTWLGFDEPKSLREYAVQTALPMWMHFMQAALKNKPETNVTEPEGLITVKIDPATGLLARSDQEDAIYEVFTTDTVPTEIAPSAEITAENETEHDEEIF